MIAQLIVYFVPDGAFTAGWETNSGEKVSIG